MPDLQSLLVSCMFLISGIIQIITIYGFFSAEVRCPKVEPPENGRADAEGNYFGARITFYCEPGYYLVGAAVSHCTLNETWSNPLPTCHGEW